MIMSLMHSNITIGDDASRDIVGNSRKTALGRQAGTLPPPRSLRGGSLLPQAQGGLVWGSHKVTSSIGPYDSPTVA
jgi:hypothetical protein